MLFASESETKGQWDTESALWNVSCSASSLARSKLPLPAPCWSQWRDAASFPPRHTCRLQLWDIGLVPIANKIHYRFNAVWCRLFLRNDNAGVLCAKFLHDLRMSQILWTKDSSWNLILRSVTDGYGISHSPQLVGILLCPLFHWNTPVLLNQFLQIQIYWSKLTHWHDFFANFVVLLVSLFSPHQLHSTQPGSTMQTVR